MMKKYPKSASDSKKLRGTFETTPKWLFEIKDQQGKHLKTLDRAVYSAYLDRLTYATNCEDQRFVDENGCYFINYSNEEMAEHLNESLAAVKRAKKKLSDLELIDIFRSRIGNRWGDSRIYLPMLPEQLNMSPRKKGLTTQTDEKATSESPDKSTFPEQLNMSPRKNGSTMRSDEKATSENPDKSTFPERLNMSPRKKGSTMRSDEKATSENPDKSTFPERLNMSPRKNSVSLTASRDSEDSAEPLDNRYIDNKDNKDSQISQIEYNNYSGNTYSEGKSYPQDSDDLTDLTLNKTISQSQAEQETIKDLEQQLKHLALGEAALARVKAKVDKAVKAGKVHDRDHYYEQALINTIQKLTQPFDY